MEVHGVAKARHCLGTRRGLRLFTLEEASRTLPLVRRIVADIVKQHKKIRSLEAECQTPPPEGANVDIEDVRHRYGAAIEKMEEFVEELALVGCDLKDRRRGVVDFRTVYQERIIEFCWHHGDEKIEFWHELNDGFHDRCMINAEFFAEAQRTDVAP